MGKADWSLDHLEQGLVAGFSLLKNAERSGRLGAGESGALAEGILQCMNGALMKVSESLEVQSQLRRELAQARDDFQKAQSAQSRRMQSLEAEVSSLRQALEGERRRARYEGARHAHRVARHSPSPDHLSRPLVLRSQQGEFLGVTDRFGQALSLDGFMRLVEGGSGVASSTDRLVASCWELCGGSWNLTLCISGKVVSRKCYILETRAVQTPSGNMVTLLSDISVDGSPVPPGYVVQMFRHLRESFQEE